MGNWATSTTLRNWRAASLGSGESYALGVERTMSIWVNACSQICCVCIAHLKPFCFLVAAENGVWCACLCSPVVSSSPSHHQSRSFKSRGESAIVRHPTLANCKALHPEQHIHKHSNTNPTTASNSVLPISAIPFKPSPSTSIRSSCGRFIRIALATVVARVWPTTSSSRFVPPSTVVAVRCVMGKSSLLVSWLWNMPGFIGSVDVVARGTCTQWASLPACEIVRRILSEKDVQVTPVGTSLTRPEDVLDVAGKGVGWTAGAAMLEESSE